MDSRLFRKKLHPLMSSHDQEENDIGQESGPESPSSTVKMASLSSPKRSKRGIQKRVVSVPIKDVEGSRLKGENSPPPADSWAWRKYGQKPIKGSPYPRGYYRCSSSKGCPARKQVERSRVDPTMLVVTYSCEHNHPWPPTSRTHGGHHHHHHHHHHNNNHHNDSTQNDDVASPKPEVTAKDENISTPPQPEPEERFADLRDESLADEFGWFGGMEAPTTTSSSIFHSHIFAAEEEEKSALFFPMREEDESLYADLGELPECSAVFRYRRGVGPEVQIC